VFNEFATGVPAREYGVGVRVVEGSPVSGGLWEAFAVYDERESEGIA
jgi:hypothetical protein